MEIFTSCFRKNQKYRYQLPISLYVDGKIMNDEYSFSLSNLAPDENGKIDKTSATLFKKYLFIILSYLNSLIALFCCLYSQKKIKTDQDLNDYFEHNQSKYILVLDLDETLIHADQRKNQKEDFSVPVNQPINYVIQVIINHQIETFYVKKRPFLNEFLEQMAEIFELVIYTASLQTYADQVIDQIDPKKLIKRRFYRNDCLRINNMYYKDLQKIEMNLEKVCIIDNSSTGYFLNQENGMLIKSWYSDQNDQELQTYAKFLKEITTKNYYNDIRKNIQYLKRQYPENIINQ